MRETTSPTIEQQVAAELEEIRNAGLYKDERILLSPQAAHVRTAMTEAINFCANNYLGLADHPDVVDAARKALEQWGFGMASVRFICGTQELHKQLERAIAELVGAEDAILYSSCFDANGGVFEVLFGADDAIISDELNHASLIDGIRLCKARRFRYRNADMADLSAQLEAAKGARRIVIVTDGVFSMDGSYAPLDEICDLAQRYDALVLVDDSHAIGFVGEHGRGTPERFGVIDRVQLVTGTLGKALGGASGGYVAGPAELVDLLRQRSRPYLFSNAVAPSVAAGSLRAIELATQSAEQRAALQRNTELFDRLMRQAGFDMLPGDHPIRPVMFPGDDGARRATQIAQEMLAEGIYVIAFSYPVVPHGQARIRVQLSAAHSEDDVRACVAAFQTARDRIDGT
ncbi:MAG: glycine C-acetyltransferase [Micrococcales bacterium]|nr:glycine C-acetyltransferase [Micrococcales bacterium]